MFCEQRELDGHGFDVLLTTFSYFEGATPTSWVCNSHSNPI